jgi:hypothetical protein
MSPAELTDADRMLRQNRGTKTLHYRDWQVTCGPLGSFQLFIQIPNGTVVGSTYTDLANAIDGIESSIANIN